MVEVFCTNVNEETEAEMLLTEIKSAWPECNANFDLEDCDKILRVESPRKIENDAIEKIVLGNGYSISVLPDVEKNKPDLVV